VRKIDWRPLKIRSTVTPHRRLPFRVSGAANTGNARRSFLGRRFDTGIFDIAAFEAWITDACVYVYVNGARSGC
jgi:hypothetical protein